MEGNNGVGALAFIEVKNIQTVWTNMPLTPRFKWTRGIHATHLTTHYHNRSDDVGVVAKDTETVEI